MPGAADNSSASTSPPAVSHPSGMTGAVPATTGVTSATTSVPAAVSDPAGRSMTTGGAVPGGLVTSATVVPAGTAAYTIAPSPLPAVTNPTNSASGIGPSTSTSSSSDSTFDDDIEVGAAVVSLWDHSKSTINEVTRTEGFDPLSEQKLLCDGAYEYLDTYQGVHPGSRNIPQPHSIYPVAKVYELLSSDTSSTSAQFRVIWYISDHERLVEDLAQFNFQYLVHTKPKLLWIKDTYVPPLAFLVPFSPVINVTVPPASSNSDVESPPLTIDLTTDIRPAVNLLTAQPPTAIVAITNSGGVGGDDEDLNDGMDTEVDIRAMDPKRLKWEKDNYIELKGLYTNKLKKAYVKIDVGGRGVLLNSFHYEDDENDMLSSLTRSKKFEFVDLVDDILLYRWELKGCLANMIKVGRKFIERLYFSLCRYRAIDQSSIRMYDCVSILITRCKDRNPVFMMKEVNGNASQIERWGWNMMKHFYAVPDILIDTDSLKQQRYQYWRCENHLYRPEKLLLLDTKSPGVRTVLDATAEQMQRAERYWAIKPGAKKATEEEVVTSLTATHTRNSKRSTTSDSSPLPSTSDLDLAKSQDNLKKAEDKIAALTKQLTKLKDEKKDSSKKQKQAKPDSTKSDANAAELKKLRDLLAESKRENSTLKAQNTVLGKRKQRELENNESSFNVQSVSYDDSRPASGSSSKYHHFFDTDVEVGERGKKVARLALEKSRIELQTQQVENQKGLARVKQEQLDRFTVQQNQILSENVVKRFDEDRAFSRQIALLELEYKHKRDQSRDMMSMVNTANDPFNLTQMLNQQRLHNHSILQWSPPIMLHQQHQQPPVKQQEQSSSSSSPIVLQQQAAHAMLQQAMSSLQQQAAISAPNSSSGISVEMLQQAVSLQQALRASTILSPAPSLTHQQSNPPPSIESLLQQVHNLQQVPKQQVAGGGDASQVAAAAAPFSIVEESAAKEQSTQSESDNEDDTDGMHEMSADELRAEIAKQRLKAEQYRREAANEF